METDIAETYYGHSAISVSLNGRHRFQRYQFPIMLAWAITVHRVQALSLDRADLTAHACVRTLSPAALTALHPRHAHTCC